MSADTRTGGAETGGDGTGVDSEMKKAVLIGLGMVAGTHGAAIAATEGRVQLHGVLSTTPDKARAFADKHAADHGLDAPKVYSGIAQVAADPEVDFVILCTPPNARRDIVRALADAGKPILMEKPVERDVAASIEIVETCEAAGIPLGIVFQHRMREASRQAADLIASGRLGALAVAEITVPWWRPQSYYDEPGRGSYARDGGGVLISQAIHTLDLALSLTGPVAKVQAMARRSALHEMESEDFVTAGLDFVSGAIGSLVASTASYPGAPESIHLHCRDGSMLLASGQLVVDWQDGRCEVIGDAGGTGGGADPMAFTHEWHQGIIEDFAAALDEGRPPVVTGRAALGVHRLIEALTQSSRQERAIPLSELE